MSLHSLPNELVILIGTHLETRPLNALLQTNRHIAALLTPVLYNRCLEDGGSQALIWAAETGNVDVIKVLHEKYNVDLDDVEREEDGSGETLCHIAIRFGHAALTKYLLDAGCCGDRITNDRYSMYYGEFNLRLAGASPVHYAAMFGCAVSLQALISHGADLAGGLFIDEDDPLIDLCDDTFEPIHFAVRGGHTKCIELFLDAGINVNHIGDEPAGITPLVKAVASNELEAVRLLLSRGADPDIRVSGDVVLVVNAFECAISYGYVDILEELLDHHPAAVSDSRLDGMLEALKEERRHRPIICKRISKVLQERRDKQGLAGTME